MNDNKQTVTCSSPWNLPKESLFEQLHTSPQGLTGEEAHERLSQFGQNVLTSREKVTPFRLFLHQFENPLVIILIFAAGISMLTGEWVDAVIILAILLASAVLGFVQEYRASGAMEKLRSQVTQTTSVLRDGAPQIIPAGISVDLSNLPGNNAQFNPNATCSIGSVTLTNAKGTQKRITLTPATGRVKLE